jgi:hypothetical protein
MPPWLIIRGSHWMTWFINTFFTTSFKRNHYNNSQSIFSRTLLPWPPRTRSILVLILISFGSVSRWTDRKHIRCPAMDICEPHRKHLFIYCIYSALHINRSYPIVACVFVAAGTCLPSRCPATGLRVIIWFSKYTDITFLNSIHWFFFVMDIQYIFCGVGTDFLKILFVLGWGCN